MKSRIKALSLFLIIASAMFFNPTQTIAQEMDMKKDEMKKKGDMKNKMDDSKMKMSMAELKTWPEAAQMAAKDMMTNTESPMKYRLLCWHG